LMKNYWRPKVIWSANSQQQHQNTFLELKILTNLVDWIVIFLISAVFGIFLYRETKIRTLVVFYLSFRTM
jgi:hypothetical protein